MKLVTWCYDDESVLRNCLSACSTHSLFYAPGTGTKQTGKSGICIAFLWEAWLFCWWLKNLAFLLSSVLPRWGRLLPSRHSVRGRLCTLEHADLINHGVNNPVKLRTITWLVVFKYVCSFSFLEKNAGVFFFFSFYSKPKNKVILPDICVAVTVSNNWRPSLACLCKWSCSCCVYLASWRQHIEIVLI